jgi:hypothetical protein
VQIWRNSQKIALVSAKNVEIHTVSAVLRGRLIYFDADFVSKEPLIERHYDHNNNIIAELPAKPYVGKFGPGVIIT